MQYEWTFHCFSDGSYWECIIIDGDEQTEKLRSEASFETRRETIQDAKRNGLDVDNGAHIVLFRRYSEEITLLQPPKRSS